MLIDQIINYDFINYLKINEISISRCTRLQSLQLRCDSNPSYHQNSFEFHWPRSLTSLRLCSLLAAPFTTAASEPPHQLRELRIDALDNTAPLSEAVVRYIFCAPTCTLRSLSVYPLSLLTDQHQLLIISNLTCLEVHTHSSMQLPCAHTCTPAGTLAFLYTPACTLAHAPRCTITCVQCVQCVDGVCCECVRVRAWNWTREILSCLCIYPFLDFNTNSYNYQLRIWVFSETTINCCAASRASLNWAHCICMMWNSMRQSLPRFILFESWHIWH